jgi:hypothetical protein
VAFDQYGDVSAPAVTWTFGEGGAITETRYVTLEEVAGLMAEMAGLNAPLNRPRFGGLKSMGAGANGGLPLFAVRGRGCDP